MQAAHHRARQDQEASPHRDRSLYRRRSDPAPGVPSYDILGNLVPFIGGEEEAFENQSMAWQTATVYFAVIELVGAVGLLAVELARRIGVTTGIFLSVVAIAGGLLGRVLTDSVPVFLATTALALAGMAVCNVLTPAWIKRHSSDGGVVLMTIYGAGLTLGGALGSLLAAPVAAAYASTWGWRAALGVWGVVALLALLPWVPILGGERRARRGRRPLPRVRQAHISTSPTALALTLLFGIQAMNAYVQFGWLPQIYRDAGLLYHARTALDRLPSGQQAAVTYSLRSA